MKAALALFLLTSATALGWPPGADPGWPHSTAATSLVPSNYGTVQAWYKADTIGLADGTSVSSWSDSGPNGYTLSQASGTKQPTYKTSIQNGLGIVRFNGTSHLIATSSGVGATSQQFVVFVVYHTTSTASQNIVGGFSGSPATFFDQSSLAKAFGGSATIADTNTNSSWKVACAVFNGASSSVQTNGNSAITGSAGTAGLINGITIGGYLASSTSSLFNGDIGEVLIYSGSCSNIPAVISALRSKWGI